ncbi:TetR/AcrR family transcriptional regulator [Delftia acidovorans]|uniref:TetR/AcrR family transcriptional regulator n=1 Tax=Delftia acidovorans TaxID=80866 RepID=UPI00286EC2AD|nr:TetR/AcrR family transcriptional regulator [Delftia acidovorans]
MESEITPAAPRPRGRPARPEHEANDAALAAATWLLLNEGYAATTMEAVARRAGLAKKTLYRFAANREDLVALVVRSWTDGFRPALSADAQSAAEVAPALAEILRVIAARVLSAEAVGMFRLLTTDFPAKPELLEVYQRNGIERGRGMLVDWLRRQCSKGLLRAEQPEVVCDLLLSMAIAEPLRQMALGLTPPVPEWDPGPRIDDAVRLLAGHSCRMESADR